MIILFGKSFEVGRTTVCFDPDLIIDHKGVLPTRGRVTKKEGDPCTSAGNMTARIGHITHLLYGAHNVRRLSWPENAHLHPHFSASDFDP